MGIGTDNPSGSLDIVRDGVQPLRIESTSGNKVRMRFANTGGSGIIENVDNDIVIPSGNVVVGSTAGTFVRQQQAGRIDLTSGLGPNSAGTVFEARANTGELTAEIRANGQFVSKGSPLTRTRDLITTLATLRNATQDETTLEGLRDSIGNAIGGLIEKFEHEIATMPVPEPEASTQ